MKVAENILTKTYALVNDPKIILAVAEDIYSALVFSVEAVLRHHDIFFNDDFGSKFAAFKKLAAEKGFKDDDISMLADFNRIIREHEASPVEFSRKDCFVICDGDYRCDVISLVDMQKYLFRARLFVEKAGSALIRRDGPRNERIS